MSITETQAASSPAALVAIIRAAHLTGDRELERSAKHELAERFGMKVSFDRGGERKGAAQ